MREITVIVRYRPDDREVVSADVQGPVPCKISPQELMRPALFKELVDNYEAVVHMAREG